MILTSNTRPSCPDDALASHPQPTAYRLRTTPDTGRRDAELVLQHKPVSTCRGYKAGSQYMSRIQSRHGLMRTLAISRSALFWVPCAKGSSGESLLGQTIDGDVRQKAGNRTVYLKVCHCLAVTLQLLCPNSSQQVELSGMSSACRSELEHQLLAFMIPRS